MYNDLSDRRNHAERSARPTYPSAHWHLRHPTMLKNQLENQRVNIGTRRTSPPSSRKKIHTPLPAPPQNSHNTGWRKTFHGTYAQQLLITTHRCWRTKRRPAERWGAAAASAPSPCPPGTCVCSSFFVMFQQDTTAVVVRVDMETQRNYLTANRTVGQQHPGIDRRKGMYDARMYVHVCTFTS